MQKNNYQLDISSLFQAAGLEKTGTVTINEHTHDYNPQYPKNHWLYATLLGFKKYQNKYGKINSYASIGAGSAIDAIGAHEIMGAKEIAVSDIHPKIPEVAKMNVKNNISTETNVTAYLGDLCQPLISQEKKFDLIYANIPNIPSDQPRLYSKDSASYYLKKENSICPTIFNDYLLTLQFLFLQETKKIINQEGAVIDAIGGRLPYEILQSLFTSNGYKFEELVSVFKIQTEPDYILKGYAEAEENNQVEFDFYNYEEAQNIWLKIEKLNLKGPELKEILKPFRVNAKTAYKNYLINKKRFGHVVHILCGRI
jgi:methylase of polypeptide subunit release factors